MTVKNELCVYLYKIVQIDILNVIIVTTKILHLKTNKAMLRRIFTEFDRKVDFQNHHFGWIRFKNRFFFIIKNRILKNFFTILYYQFNYHT